MKTDGWHMVEGVEGLGEVVTGGMAARAVESGAGEPAGTAEHCLNCGAELIGEYCHLCGQKAHVHRSLGAIGHELAHSVLHFEGKVWRTLPALAWRPGDLTRRYIAGERARYVSPMALFLFSVFLMFAVFSSLGGPISPGVEAQPEVRKNIDAERQLVQRRITDLEQTRASLSAEGKSTQAVDAELAKARAEAGTLAAISGATRGQLPEDGFEFKGVPADTPAWIRAVIDKVRENPSLLVYKLQTNAYKFSWALIPISVPFLWLLFAFRRKYGVYDHTVFVTYSIAFMTLLVVTLSLLRAIGLGGGWIPTALTLLPPLHMYRQLRGAYLLSRFSAAWRAVALAFFALCSGLLFFMLLVAIGIM